MSNERMNRHPEFLQETMFQEHGTKVIITNPNAEKYLHQYRAAQRKIKEKYPQWQETTEEE